MSAMSPPHKRQKNVAMDKNLTSTEGNEGPSVMWFRSDLRVLDNPALYNCFARSHGNDVIAVFIIAEKEWQAHDFAPCKVDFILQCLQTLKLELWHKFSIPLYIRHGSFLSRTFLSFPPDRLPSDEPTADVKSNDCTLTPQILLQLCRETGATSVHFNQEYEVDETMRDKHVADYLTKRGISVYPFHDQCVSPPGSVLTKEQKPYTVFTPFRSTWYNWIESHPQSLTLSPLPEKNTKSKSILASNDDIPGSIQGFEMVDSNYAVAVRKAWPAGPGDAQKMLDDFASTRLAKYNETRDFPSTSGTSCLSPYLSVGVLSVRQCIVAAITPANTYKPDIKLIKSGNQGIVTWISELCWRDFYRHVLFFFPHVCKGKPFKLSSDYVTWRSDQQEFQRWCDGKTGYPIVDAGMRQLNATGWMHNRVRMITAMFLAKDLLIDWRLGESYFMKHLIDGDFASNNGGWQWSASTGTDAQPYFRVFNPVLQSKKNDPDGEYIRRWVPELAGVDKNHIHDPFKTLSPTQFAKLGYPKPIVEHDFARQRAIDAFKKVFAK